MIPFLGELQRILFCPYLQLLFAFFLSRNYFYACESSKKFPVFRFQGVYLLKFCLNSSVDLGPILYSFESTEVDADGLKFSWHYCKTGMCFPTCVVGKACCLNLT